MKWFSDRMMFEQRTATRGWLAYLDLTCVTIAGGAWYVSHQWWPLVIALAPWFIRFALTGRLTRHTPFDLPMVLFLLTAAVGVWAAYDRTAAWARFWMIVGGVLVFYALANAESAGNVRIWFLALFGAGMATHFVLTHDWQAYSIKIGALARLGQALQQPLPPLPGPRFNPNVVAGTIAAMLPFAGLTVVQSWRALRKASRPRPAGLWLALGLGLAVLTLSAFGLLMTASRSAWLAIVAALLLAGMWLVAGLLGRGSPQRRVWIFAGWLGLGLAAVGVAFLAYPGLGTALLDLLPGPSNVGTRAELMRNSLILLRDYPLTGIGLGAFMMIYSSYVMLVHVGYITHAHNLFLDVALEQGLLALLVFVWMCALLFRGFWREQLRTDGQRRGSEMAAAAFALLVILLYGLVDDPVHSSGAVLLLFSPLAFLPSQPRERKGQRARWVFLTQATAVILLLTMALVWRDQLLSRLASNLGAVHQSQVELGVYSWPEWPIQDEVRRQASLEQPAAEYERALALDPRNSTANRRLGMLELSWGEYEAALSHLEMAYTVEPGSVTTRQLYGEALIVNGRVDEGRALWEGVSNAQGQLDIRAWWYRHIGEEERAEWIEQAANSLE